jgi:hypothetical protein
MEPTSYIIIDPQGYFLGQLTVSGDIPPELIDAGNTVTPGVIDFKSPPLRNWPDPASGVRVGYHVERGRWENTSTGEEYINSFTIATL